MNKTPIAKSRYDWLSAQIDAWQNAGLISDTQGQSLLSRYECQDRLPWMVWLLGLVGALFVGGGVILLLAHHWDELSRLLRSMIALSPLIVMQTVCLTLFWQGKSRSVLGEACALLLAAALGAAIALVSQNYHFYGELWQFFALWLALLLPAAMLLRSRVAFAAVMLLLIACIVDLHGYFFSLPWVYFFLVILVFVFCAVYIYHIRGLPEFWAFLLALPFVCLLFDDYKMRNLLWPTLIGVYYIVGAYLPQKGVKNPARTLGTLGMSGVVFALVFLRSDFSYYKIEHVETAWLLQLTMLALAVLVAVKRRFALPRQLSFWPMVLFPCLWLWIATHATAANQGSVYLFIYAVLIIAALLIVYTGLGQARLFKSNAGIFLIIAVFLRVFYEGNWSFFARGVAFIVCGILLFALNVYFVKRRKLHARTA